MRKATAEKLAIALLAVYFAALVVNIGARTGRYQWDFAAYYHAFFDSGFGSLNCIIYSFFLFF